jgi:hypothetical protein
MAILIRLWCITVERSNVPPVGPERSVDTVRARHPKFGHAVQRARGDGRLRPLCFDAPRPQTVSEHALPSRVGPLRCIPAGVASRPLPRAPALLRDVPGVPSAATQGIEFVSRSHIRCLRSEHTFRVR